MINLLQPTDNGILDNRPVGDRDPILPRFIKCENPHEIMRLIEDFHGYKDELDEKNKEIQKKAKDLYNALEAVEGMLREIRETADELFAMGDE